MSTPHRVLVPFELPDHKPVPAGVVEEIAALEVVVLGHFQLPEQTPPAVGRDQFEAEAEAELEQIASAFEGGASVTTRLVFGQDRAKTIDRVALEEACDVVVTGGATATATGTVERLLVPLRGADNIDGVVEFVAELQTATDATVTLFHSATPEDRRPGQELLDDAADGLHAAGVDPGRIDTRLSEGGDPMSEVVELAETYDVVVLGETEPSLRERLLGDVPARISARTKRPVFVVRAPRESVPDDADPATPES